MVPITRLHDPCLVALFKQLPPADQMIARTVCRRWADLVQYAARSTRSLAIFVGDDPLEAFERMLNRYSLGSIKVVSRLQKNDGSAMFPLKRFNPWNSLLYRELDEATVNQIADTFLNINNLQVALSLAEFPQFNFIPSLLEQWHQQLTTLKLCGDSYLFKANPKHSPNRLFAAINGLTKLKNLHLHLAYLPFRDLTIISRLEHLDIYWDECSPSQFTALLRQHVKPTNTTLRSIEYRRNCVNSAIDHFTTLDTHLLDRFTRFSFTWSTYINTELIAAHFHNLTSLRIYPTTTTLRRLYGHLNQLNQLLYLRLGINFEFIHPDDQPHLLLRQLKSVKALELYLKITTHHQLEQLVIGWTIPNVEIIEFYLGKSSKCTDCSIEEFHTPHIQGNLPTVKHCFRQMLTLFKRTCIKLRTILHNHEAILGSAEELLLAE